MELQNPGDLKISEVMELLRDYRRLAGALKDLGGCLGGITTIFFDYFVYISSDTTFLNFSFVFFFHSMGCR